MKISMLKNAAMLMTILFIFTASVFAKDPLSADANSLTRIAVRSTSSLTPPPKEWAMFPQDEAPVTSPLPPPQNGQNPSPAKGPGAPGNSNASAASDNTSGLVSAPNARPVQHKELPLFWLLLTGALSLGAITACGSLILRKDATIVSDASIDGAAQQVNEIPVVSELQEIKA